MQTCFMLREHARNSLSLSHTLLTGPRERDEEREREREGERKRGRKMKREREGGRER